MLPKLSTFDILILAVFSVAVYAFQLYIYLTFNYFLLNDLIKIVIWPPDLQYDYIVVGAGTAGSIIAKRLARANFKVLVLEAGTEGGSLLDVPAMGLMLQKSPYDWAYKTTPQKHSCRAFVENRSTWPRGKIIGGSGRLNYMVYLRGHRAAYDKWFANAPAYNYETDVLYYFRKSENYYQDARDMYHGTSGYLPVSKLFFQSELVRALLSAARTFQFPIGDLNRNVTVGFMTTEVNAVQGQRWTPGHTLTWRMERNVHLYASAHVNRVLFNGLKANGVEFRSFFNTYTVHARRGVILAAGSINTPKLLMLSGIGPAHHLHEKHIAVKANLSVGRNLKDHITTGLDLFVTNTTFAMSLANMLNPFAALNYLLGLKSAWTSPGCEAIGFINYNDFKRKRINETAIADLEIMMMPVSVSEDNGIFAMTTTDFKPDVWSSYFRKTSGQQRVVMLPMLLYPESSGYIRLRDNNPTTAPVINPNYLSAKRDVDTMVNGLKFLMELVEAESFKPFDVRVNPQPFPGCEMFEFLTDDYWTCYVRRLTMTVYHPCGTCRMGAENDPDAVVDFKFKVKSTTNLYVGDASIFPDIPGSNINAAVAMMAEKLVDTIKYEMYMDTSTCARRDQFLHVNLCRMSPV